VRQKPTWYHPKDKGLCSCGCPSHVTPWNNVYLCRNCLIDRLIEENKILRETHLACTTCPICGEINNKEE